MHLGPHYEPRTGRLFWPQIPFRAKPLSFQLNNICNHWAEACEWVKS